MSSTIKSPQLKWTRDYNDLTPLKITFAVALFQNLLRTALSLAGGNTVPENLLTRNIPLSNTQHKIITRLNTI